MEKPAIPKVKRDGVCFEDLDIQYVLLPYGTYKVDGELMSVDSRYKKERIGVKNIDDIRIVCETEITTHYTSGIDSKTTQEYEDDKIKLLSKSWDTLEDEYEYKKFMQVWKPIKKVVQTFSDPIEVEIVKTKYNTGNPFVVNALVNGMKSDASLFTYDQDAAWRNIVRECFKELDMEYRDGISYGKTDNAKIWGNSTHSCIRYVVAFGTYVFNDDWKSPRLLTGTLKDMLNMYEKDRKGIRDIIITKYNKHFGKIDSMDFNFDELLNKLRVLQSNIEKTDPKRKTINEWNVARNKTRECIEMILKNYKTNE